MSPDNNLNEFQPTEIKSPPLQKTDDWRPKEIIKPTNKDSKPINSEEVKHLARGYARKIVELANIEENQEDIEAVILGKEGDLEVYKQEEDLNEETVQNLMNNIVAEEEQPDLTGHFLNKRNESVISLTFPQNAHITQILKQIDLINKYNMVNNKITLIIRQDSEKKPVDTKKAKLKLATIEYISDLIEQGKIQPQEESPPTGEPENPPPTEPPSTDPTPEKPEFKLNYEGTDIEPTEPLEPKTFTTKEIEHIISQEKEDIIKELTNEELECHKQTQEVINNWQEENEDTPEGTVQVIPEENPVIDKLLELLDIEGNVESGQEFVGNRGALLALLEADSPIIQTLAFKVFNLSKEKDDLIVLTAPMDKRQELQDLLLAINVVPQSFRRLRDHKFMLETQRLVEQHKEFKKYNQYFQQARSLSKTIRRIARNKTLLKPIEDKEGLESLTEWLKETPEEELGPNLILEKTTEVLNTETLSNIITHYREQIKKWKKEKEKEKEKEEGNTIKANILEYKIEELEETLEQLQETPEKLELLNTMPAPNIEPDPRIQEIWRSQELPQRAIKNITSRNLFYPTHEYLEFLIGLDQSIKPSPDSFANYLAKSTNLDIRTELKPLFSTQRYGGDSIKTVIRKMGYPITNLGTKIHFNQDKPLTYLHDKLKPSIIEYLIQSDTTATDYFIKRDDGLNMLKALLTQSDQTPNIFTKIHLDLTYQKALNAWFPENFPNALLEAQEIINQRRNDLEIQADIQERRSEDKIVASETKALQSLAEGYYDALSAEATEALKKLYEIRTRVLHQLKQKEIGTGITGYRARDVMYTFTSEQVTLSRRGNNIEHPELWSYQDQLKRNNIIPYNEIVDHEGQNILNSELEPWFLKPYKPNNLEHLIKLSTPRIITILERLNSIITIENLLNYCTPIETDDSTDNPKYQIPSQDTRIPEIQNFWGTEAGEDLQQELKELGVDEIFYNQLGVQELLEIKYFIEYLKYRQNHEDATRIRTSKDIWGLQNAKCPTLLKRLQIPEDEYIPPDIIIPKGKITVLSGPNGSGKTTLAKNLISGTLPFARYQGGVITIPEEDGRFTAIGLGIEDYKFLDRDEKHSSWQTTAYQINQILYLAQRDEIQGVVIEEITSTAPTKESVPLILATALYLAQKGIAVQIISHEPKRIARLSTLIELTEQVGFTYIDPASREVRSGISDSYAPEALKAVGWAEDFLGIVNAMPGLKTALLEGGLEDSQILDIKTNEKNTHQSETVTTSETLEELKIRKALELELRQKAVHTTDIIDDPYLDYIEQLLTGNIAQAKQFRERVKDLKGISPEQLQTFTQICAPLNSLLHTLNQNRNVDSNQFENLQNSIQFWGNLNQLSNTLPENFDLEAANEQFNQILATINNLNIESKYKELRRLNENPDKNYTKIKNIKRKIEENRKKIRNIISASPELITLSELNTLIEITNLLPFVDLIQDQTYCEAEYGGNTMVVKELASPLIRAQGEDDKPITFTSAQQTEEGTPRPIVGTGLAGSGKTSTLQSIGFAATMAVLTDHAPAKKFQIVRRPENIIAQIEPPHINGLSAFYSVASVLKTQLESAGPGTLFIADQPAPGTNELDTSALTALILEYLTRKGTHSIITTHATDTLTALRAISERKAKPALLAFRESTDVKRHADIIPGEVGGAEALEVAEEIGVPTKIINLARGMQELLEQYEKIQATILN